MEELISKNQLIKDFDAVAMEHHKTHIPMVEHDFYELIHNAPIVDVDKEYEEQMQQERTEMGAVK